MNRYCEGKNVVLRQVAVSDAETVAAWKTDPLIRDMALDPDTRISVDTERRDIQTAVDSPGQLYLLIMTRNAEKPVGYIRINWMDSKQTCAWLRFAMGAERRRGYARDALTALIQKLIQDGLHRIDAEVYAVNTASLRLLSTLGFQREGVKRKAHFDGMVYHDIVVLGLLREDFVIHRSSDQMNNPGTDR